MQVDSIVQRKDNISAATNDRVRKHLRYKILVQRFGCVKLVIWWEQ